MKIFGKGPWPLSTIVLTSIVFTPIVGGILAALNERRLGHPERRWREYTLSFLAFLWYLVYFSFSLSASIQELFFPPIAIVNSLLISPMTSLLFLGLPSAAVIYILSMLQHKSWNEDLVGVTARLGK